MNQQLIITNHRVSKESVIFIVRNKMRFEGKVKEIMTVYLVRNNVPQSSMVFIQYFDAYLSDIQM